MVRAVTSARLPSLRGLSWTAASVQGRGDGMSVAKGGRSTRDSDNTADGYGPPTATCFPSPSAGDPSGETVATSNACLRAPALRSGRP